MDTSIRTLAIILGITHVMQVMVFFHQYRIIKVYQGIGWWLLWSAAEAIGFSIMLFRDVSSILPVVIIVQNLMIVAGALFLYIGVRRFFNKALNLKLLIPVVLLFFIGMLYFLFIQNEIRIRSGIFCLTLAIISFFTAHSLFGIKNRAITASVHFNATIFLLHGGIFATRAVVLFISPVAENFFAPTLFNFTPYFEALIVSLLWTFGLVIMINHRLNAEVSEAKSDLQMIFNTSPDAAIISRLDDGMIVDINDGYTAITGYSREDLAGKTAIEINIWKDLKDRQNVIDLVKTQGYCNNYEARFICKDGVEITGLMSAKIIYIQGISHLISISREITERKEIENEIRKIGLHYQALIENASDGIVLLNAEFKFTYASPAARNFFGYSLSDEIKVNPNEFTHPDDLPLVLSHLVRILEDPSYVPTIQYRFADKNGNWKWVESTFSNLLGDPNVQSIVINFRDITNRKQAEEKLLESEKRLANIYDTVGDVIFLLAVEDEGKYRFISTNQAFCKVTGLKQENVVGKTVNEVIPGSSLKMVMENYSQAIAEKRIIRWEETSDYPNGRVTGVVSIVPVFNDKGICINLVGSVHDITERKLVEENLQISEKKYRNLVENALIGIYTTTLEGQHNFINDAMCKILEYDTIDELLRAPVDTTYKNIAERNKLIETLKKSQKIFNYELELVTKEGKTKDVLVNAFLSGKVITGMIMDISERKRAEKVIRESEEKYRQLLENSGIGVGVFSLEGKIQYLNQKAIHYLGGRTKDYIGRSLPEVFGEQAAEIFLARFQEVVKSDKSIEFEDFVHMDKGDYWFLSNQTRIKSPDGKIIAVQILAHDITERKNAEVELMRNIAELQRFQNLTVGRELTMIKLKKEVNELLKKTGQENKYKIVE